MADARSVSELVEVAEPAWPGLAELIAGAALPVTVLPVSAEQGREVLYRLQVTARSPLGALALNCGGLLIDHGWLRVLGGGGNGLPDLATANSLNDPEDVQTPPQFLVVAYDVLGGRFAVDGGGLGVRPGEVCYWGPDTMEWTGIGVGHGDFVAWTLTDGPTGFYRDLRWPTWADEVSQLLPSDGITVYPPLFSTESRPIENTSRRPVPFSQLLQSHQDMAAQLADLPDGASVVFKVKD
ncbi:DUF2625 family protein [Kribbella sp. NPDC051587]|uniref:DUF2625 family protein n=1 Tax=Kribbella sp. NPDC051587 TaxID=3364119 RepID=UPI0037AFA047